MTPAELIAKKRDGGHLTDAEIRQFVNGLSDGTFADYQATAFLMATFFRGMTLDETVSLTRAMLESGDRYSFKDIAGPKVDKHSTGGVGDKVSLILAPLAAACGLKVPMMSGRGLGHTGGTVDKLEAIPGFNMRMPESGIRKTLAQVGCAMLAQSEKIAPADRKLYALRDVTGTIECMPLIAASILSKKLAEGTESLVLDVKVGNGAFMKTRDAAAKLARLLTQVGKKLGLPVRALLTDMSQPLGTHVGNALEVKECISLLQGKTPAGSQDLKEITLVLCAQMLEVSGLVKNSTAARKLAQDRLADGSAWRLFRELVSAQGGNVAAVDRPELLPTAEIEIPVTASKKGVVVAMHTERIGHLVVEMGGGRRLVTDVIDPAVGIVFHKKLGARVNAGELLATLHVRTTQEKQAKTQWVNRLQEAYTVSATRKPLPPLVRKVKG